MQETNFSNYSSRVVVLHKCAKNIRILIHREREMVLTHKPSKLVVTTKITQAISRLVVTTNITQWTKVQC